MRKSNETRLLKFASVTTAIAGCLPLIACGGDAMLLSKNLYLSDPRSIDEGLVYYLPKTIVKLDFTSYGYKVKSTIEGKTASGGGDTPAKPVPCTTPGVPNVPKGCVDAKAPAKCDAKGLPKGCTKASAPVDPSGSRRRRVKR